MNTTMASFVATATAASAHADAWAAAARADAEVAALLEPRVVARARIAADVRPADFLVVP